MSSWKFGFSGDAQAILEPRKKETIALIKFIEKRLQGGGSSFAEETT
jgi:hypothetical protein